MKTDWTDIYSYRQQYEMKKAQEVFEEQSQKNYDKRKIVELQAQLLNMMGEQHAEQKLREQHPTVMDAWEQYQMAIKLVQQ